MPKQFPDRARWAGISNLSRLVAEYFGEHFGEYFGNLVRPANLLPDAALRISVPLIHASTLDLRNRFPQHTRPGTDFQGELEAAWSVSQTWRAPPLAERVQFCGYSGVAWCVTKLSEDFMVLMHDFWRQVCK